MADQHIVADDGRAFGLGGLWAIAMDDAAILDIGARTNHDPADIGTQHAIIPDARLRPDGDIADDPASGRDERAFVDLWCLAMNGDDRDVRTVGHLIIFQKET